MTLLTPVDYERAKEAQRRGTLKIRSVAYALEHAHQSGWSMLHPAMEHFMSPVSETFRFRVTSAVCSG